MELGLVLGKDSSNALSKLLLVICSALVFLATANASNQETVAFNDEVGTPNHIAVLEQSIFPKDETVNLSFGQQVYTDGDFAYVTGSWTTSAGEPAYGIYEFVNQENIWHLNSKIIANVDGEELIEFGPLLVKGGQLFVAINDLQALEADGRRISKQNSVLVFARTTTEWFLKEKILPPNDRAPHMFGSALARDGNLLFIGSAARCSGELGCAHIYQNVDDSWVYQQELSIDGLSSLVKDGVGGFGKNIVVLGDDLFISSYSSYPDVGTYGRVHYFKRENGLWIKKQELKAPYTLINDNYGDNIAFDGSTLIIGSSGDRRIGYPQGSVYVYEFRNEKWVWVQKIFGEAGSLFGTKLAINQGTLVVDSSIGLYVYKRLNGEFVERWRLPFEGSQRQPPYPSLQIEGDLTISDNRILLGQPRFTSSEVDTGRALYFDIPTKLNIYSAFASSVIAADKVRFSPQRAIDGKKWTQWISGQSDEEWIVFDLAASNTLEQLLIHWGEQYASEYQLFVSEDFAHWTEIDSVSGGEGGMDRLNISGVKARYLGILCTQKANDEQYSIWDVEILGRSASQSSDRVNLALGQPAYASSVDSQMAANFVASNAVDGDSTTRWSSDARDNQWLYVDLGSSRIFNEVTIYWDQAFGRNYQLWASDNAIDWTLLSTVEDSDGGQDVVSLGQSNARYVGVLGTQRATSYGFSILEFEVR